MEYIASIDSLKQKGLSAVEAAKQVLNYSTEVQKPDDITFASIAAALKTVYALTLIELVRALKAAGASINDAARAAKDAIETEEPGKTVSVMELAEALKEVYEIQDRILLKEALEYAGYSSEEVTRTVNALFPTAICIISSRSLFQETGVELVSNEKAVIEYQSGTWCVSPYTGSCDANGSARYPCAKEGYALQGAPEGALVGKIGDTVFHVGKKAETPADKAGKLRLCANDDLYARYGSGFADNSGEITVKITVKSK
jgi:hypothetical protein